MHHLPQLALHHRADLLGFVRVALRQTHDLQAVANRSQRVAQFMGQRGQKLVLALVLLLKTGDQSLSLFLAPLAVGDVGHGAVEACHPP